MAWVPVDSFWLCKKKKNNKKNLLVGELFIYGNYFYDLSI